MFSRFRLSAGVFFLLSILIRTDPAVVGPDPALLDNLPPAKPGPDDWPWWRGTTRDNKSADNRPPLHWSRTQAIIWKVPVPGRGHASPTIWGDRVFIATADETARIQSMLCYQRNTGQLLWQTEIARGGFLRKHENNSHASATPACDGERVFFPSLFNDALWVTALAMDGKILWQRKIGQFVSSNGYGSSPLLHKSLVIVVSDNAGEACLAALNRMTGRVVWRVERPKLDNFCSPALGCVAGRAQLLLCGSRMIAGYDPDTGRELWYFENSTEVSACTMAFGTNLVVGSGNVPVREMICVRAGGTGNVTQSHLQWRTKRTATYVPSPLIEGNRLYVINDSGIAHCIDLESGDEIWKERLSGDFFSSPVLCDGKIYATARSGSTFILKAADKFEVLTTNDLNEECFASPVICGHRLFLRTARTLYCVGEPD